MKFKLVEKFNLHSNEHCRVSANPDLQLSDLRLEKGGKKNYLSKILTETQERTVYNALAAYPNYRQKYGQGSALFELKYNFRLTDEELCWLINKLESKGYIDEFGKEQAIRDLHLEDVGDDLNEAYLDDKETFWDYRTGKVIGKDIFDINRGESSFVSDMLRLAKTGEVDHKGRAAKIKEMSPREYFKATADGFNSTYDSQIRQIKNDKDILDHLRQVLTKYKRKFPVTYINLNPEGDQDFFQEGRHRMYVAGEMFGWDTKFPVLQIYTKDVDRMAAFKKQENETKVLKALNRAINKSTRYSYKDVDEVKEQLEYSIEKELEDIYKYKKLSFVYSQEKNNLLLVIDGEDWITIDLNKFDIDPNKEEVDLSDLDNLDDEEMSRLEKELGLKFNESLEGEYLTFIVNPEDNPKLAKELTDHLKAFKSTFRCKRDNCGLINGELRDYLQSSGFEAKRVLGEYKVDDLSYINKDDLYLGEQERVLDEYGDLGYENIQKWVNSQDRENFNKIPHYWVMVDNLILDAAFPMFKKYVDKNKKERYVKEF